ncbi:hypothetical protein VN97_g8724 [Penicillium thymicola]|uniref:HAT C-terminal dimerisation domain-containing protein n=1 Tax=Penicillium thymicola TaxID=293382 RepID=A0AAI9TCW4_PENTH|nr:hypothetical protein VN97_g8724 [Penicillium thymicola]
MGLLSTLIVMWWKLTPSNSGVITNLVSLRLHGLLEMFSIPANGAGVERLFNTARDVCHYRRGRLESETIEETMLYLCASRFDLKDTEVKQHEKYFTLHEIEASKEQNPENLEKMEFDSISDNEEDEVVAETATCNMLIDLGVEGEDTNESHSPVDEPQLPENGTQLRTSGSKRKYREDNDIEQY